MKRDIKIIKIIKTRKIHFFKRYLKTIPIFTSCYFLADYIHFHFDQHYESNVVLQNTGKECLSIYSFGSKAHLDEGGNLSHP